MTNIRTGFSGEAWMDDFEPIKKESGEEIDVSKINYFKLHGSLDWEMENGYLKGSSSHEPSKNPWIIFGEESKMVSIEPFLSLLIRFKERLKSADFVVCIGYSFFDTYINNLLLQSVNTSGKKLIIVDIKDESKDQFLERLKYIQENDFNHRNNTLSIASEKLHLISKTSAVNFLKDHLGRNAKGLLDLINKLESEMVKEESPF